MESKMENRYKAELFYLTTEKEALEHKTGIFLKEPLSELPDSNTVFRQSSCLICFDEKIDHLLGQLESNMKDKNLLPYLKSGFISIPEYNDYNVKNIPDDIRTKVMEEPTPVLQLLHTLRCMYILMNKYFDCLKLLNSKYKFENEDANNLLLACGSLMEISDFYHNFFHTEHDKTSESGTKSKKGGIKGKKNRADKNAGRNKRILTDYFKWVKEKKATDLPSSKTLFAKQRADEYQLTISYLERLISKLIKSVH